ncbi:MAG: glucose-1-phosphate adenylyltransferase subunit GlgD, partial [Clostridiales bacterium]|jgi:glucose-1-phosphate adenylyltransferase|nr:glucose-1-phosphate adenylyltransferase subunit GlgD [Clostridiales bacterium]
MDFLRREIHEEFLRQAPYIETKPKDEPPAKYNHSAEVKDSLVGSGSILNGRVERSVLFRRVTTCENSVIKNSVIMEGCHIGSHCVVENAIIDKEVVISDGKSVIGTPTEPLIIGKRALV